MSAADITNFTFLHRVEEVEFNIQDRRWQSALALGLTLPDICGGIAFPDMVKRYRDGQDIRIDIEQFCLRMCQAARNYYEDAHLEKDFSLYNTPVLDFVKAAETGFPKEIIAVLSGEERYGNGLQKILRELPVQPYVSTSPEVVRKKLGRKKLRLWVVTEEILAKANR